MNKSTLHTIIIRLTIIILVIAAWSACDEYMGFVDCKDCFYPEPDSADLTIYLTINNDHPEVPIVVYRGNVDNDTYYIDTAVISPYYLYSKIDQFYSVRAEYKVGDRTINVVDGDKVKAKHVSESCDGECWIITDGVLNVELKFDEE
ncbi:MAG: hypothetical protein ISS19_12485 [Bacteroidales bacterium]|nr:hypothetical protein [Bacteroidales bacterium]